MSNSNTTQETLEIMKESEKKLVEESVNKNKFVSRSPSKEEVEKDGEEANVRQESQRRTSNHGHARKRAKSNSKLKLVRSLAVCEESSSPFVDGPLESQDIIQLHVSCPSDKEEEKSTKDGPEKEEKDKNKEKAPRKMLSRDSSQEYTDSTGIDLHEFLVNTLKKNPRDRMMLLKLEQEILEFISDNNNQFKKFPQMTSYHRMLLHRVAAYFGMDHNVDQTGKAVIINKTSNTRIPEQRFSEHIKDERNVDFPQRFILKRDDASMDRDDNQIRIPLQDGRRSKSIEEREEEYQRVRERIFARETGQNGYLNESRLSKEGFSSSSHKRRQIFRGNRDSVNRASGSRQSSTESELKSLEPRPWSSTDSDSSIRNLRPPVTKASSFSGISILTRGDSIGGSKGSNASRTSRPGLSLGAPEACSQVSSSQPGRGSFLPCTVQPQQQPALAPAPQQQPAMSNHMISPPVPALQPVQYSPSSCPQVLLPVSPPQQYNMADELSTPFGQISLSRQGSTEAPDPSSAMFQPPLISQQPGFIMASPGQPVPASNYSTSGHTAPAQQVLQPQGYMQPPQQIQVSYYPPGQYPNSSQQYRPLSHPVAYSPQQNQQLPQPSQQPGLQPMVSNQQQTYQGMMGVQPSQTPGLLNNQRGNMGNQMQSMLGVQPSQTPGLLSNQRGNMGNQMQGLMVQYTALPSYQVPVASESQAMVQQPVLVPASQSVQGGLPSGGMPVYYSVIPTAQQNGTSPSVGFLQPPGSEQYPMPQSPSPCSPPQMQQQYSGQYPADQPHHVPHSVPGAISCDHPQQRLPGAQPPPGPHTVPPARGPSTRRRTLLPTGPAAAVQSLHLSSSAVQPVQLHRTPGPDGDEARKPGQETGPQVSVHRPGHKRHSPGPRAGGDGPARGHHAHRGREALHPARHGRGQDPVAEGDSGAARGRRRRQQRPGGERPAPGPRRPVHRGGRVPQPAGRPERLAAPQQLAQPLPAARGQEELRPAGAGTRQFPVGPRRPRPRPGGSRRQPASGARPRPLLCSGPACLPPARSGGVFIWTE
ncbi:R3H domain-containing protein 2 isoform X2 [Emydura macquarii macquarii]|uniref:R3H domain-containing protein 2 isoform X2 n=1 Tax=Emydura macquarii macquarii TaxID=1129001 RepID=UPI00352A0616